MMSCAPRRFAGKGMEVAVTSVTYYVLVAAGVGVAAGLLTGGLLAGGLAAGDLVGAGLSAVNSRALILAMPSVRLFTSMPFLTISRSEGVRSEMNLAVGKTTSESSIGPTACWMPR